MEVNPYALLGLTPVASSTQIQFAYRRLAARVHPDRGGDAQRFSLVRESYEMLIDPLRRKEWDDTHPVLMLSREVRESVCTDLVMAWLECGG